MTPINVLVLYSLGVVECISGLLCEYWELFESRLNLLHTRQGVGDSGPVSSDP